MATIYILAEYRAAAYRRAVHQYLAECNPALAWFF